MSALAMIVGPWAMTYDDSLDMAIVTFGTQGNQFTVAVRGRPAEQLSKLPLHSPPSQQRH
jgi:hypothetical protein